MNQANAGKVCSDPDCDRDAKCKGMCFRHYQRVQRGGPRGGVRNWRTRDRCKWCAAPIGHMRADAKWCSSKCQWSWQVDGNRPAHYEAVKRWQEKNPDTVAAIRVRRRRRQENSDHGCITADTLRELRSASDGKCAYCPAPGGQYDHFEPLARGGAHCIANLIYACARCNRSKCATPLEQWRPSLVGRVSPPLSCQEGAYQKAA